MVNYEWQINFQNPKTVSKTKNRQKFSSNLLKLWQMAVNISDLVFAYADGTLKLSSLPLQAERHLSSRWLSLLGSAAEVKRVLGLLGLEDRQTYLPWSDWKAPHFPHPRWTSEAPLAGIGTSWAWPRFCKIWSSGRNWATATWDGCIVQRLGEECFPIGLQHPGPPVG